MHMPRIWILIAVTTMMSFIVSARMAPPLSIGPDATIKADEVAVPDRIQNSGLVEALTTVLVASGLNRPVFVTAPPEDFNRLFIVEKRGVIKILDLTTGVVLAVPFLDIDALVGGGTTQNSEQGLLGLAFHPNYAVFGFFYVSYTDNFGDTVIARYVVSGDPEVADAASAHPIMSINQPQTNHNGGWIGFGPNDGYLYIATGDGGGGGDDDSGHTAGTGNSQDITNNLLGKMLRIDVNGDDFPADANRNFVVPPDNPFVGVTGDDEIWSYGLRNPWRPSFDRESGDLYIADVGQQLWEEIDFQPASSPGGENYGWRCREGAHDFNFGAFCGSLTFTEPIHEYAHGGSPFRCSITGGYVYRGCAIPSLQGTYFFADWCSRQIWSFRYDGVTLTELTDRTVELDPAGGASIIDIASFGEDAAGEIYIVEQNITGEIFKIVPAVLTDTNGNGIPDGCDLLACPSDFDLSGQVNVTDLLLLLGAWGPNPGHVADSNGDGNVNVTDLLLLLGAWGACP